MAADKAKGRPLRVLLFSTLYPSASRPGHGAFVETRLQQLMRSGEVTARVLAPVPWFPSADPRFGAWAKVAATPRREVRGGLDIHHPRYLLPPKVGQTMAPLSLALAAWLTLRRWLRSGETFDVIDAHYFYPDGVAAALLSRWSGIPLVISARGSDLFVLGQHRLARQMMHWAAHRAAASVGVCQALVDILKCWGIPAARLAVLPNGVDLERFHPVERGTARQLTGVAGEPALLCVGNLVPIKGHALAIEALARLHRTHPRASLTLVGEGPCRAVLADLAASLGLAPFVKFAGRIPNDALAPWYASADLLVLPSFSEGWANVLLESMACGTPVISTDVGGSAEVVCQPVAGSLLRARDPAQLADLIDRRWRQGFDRTDVRAFAEGFGWGRTSRAQLQVLRRAAFGTGDVPRA